MSITVQYCVHLSALFLLGKTRVFESRSLSMDATLRNNDDDFDDDDDDDDQIAFEKLFF